MGYLTCKFVRPDKQIFEGKVASVVLATYTGELGILPGHASEICALGNGVVRMNLLPEDGGGVRRVVVSGGYAEVHKNTVVVIADHARREDDIEPNVVLATRKAAEESRDAPPRTTTSAPTTRIRLLGAISFSLRQRRLASLSISRLASLRLDSITIRQWM